MVKGELYIWSDPIVPYVDYGFYHSTTSQGVWYWFIRDVELNYTNCTNFPRLAVKELGEWK